MHKNLKKSLIFCASTLMLLGFGGLMHQNGHVNADEVSSLTEKENLNIDAHFGSPDNKYSRDDFEAFRVRALNEAKNGVPVSPQFTYNQLIDRYLNRQGFSNYHIYHGEFHHKLNEAHQKNFGYHQGIPKTLVNTAWNGKKYYNRKHTHYVMVKYFFTNYAPGFSEYVYNRRNHEISASAGSGSAWDAYYRYLGHHTYQIVSGIGKDGTYARLTRHNILHNSAPLITDVKLLKHHRALIGGNYFTLVKHSVKVNKRTRKHIKRIRKHVRKPIKRTKRSKRAHHRK